MFIHYEIEACLSLLSLNNNNQVNVIKYNPIIANPLITLPQTSDKIGMIYIDQQPILCGIYNDEKASIPFSKEIYNSIDINTIYKMFDPYKFNIYSNSLIYNETYNVKPLMVYNNNIWFNVEPNPYLRVYYKISELTKISSDNNSTEFIVDIRPQISLLK